jgi:hypothetical protein
MICIIKCLRYQIVISLETQVGTACQRNKMSNHGPPDILEMGSGAMEELASPADRSHPP